MPSDFRKEVNLCENNFNRLMELFQGDRCLELCGSGLPMDIDFYNTNIVGRLIFLANSNENASKGFTNLVRIVNAGREIPNMKSLCEDMISKASEFLDYSYVCCYAAQNGFLSLATKTFDDALAEANSILDKTGDDANLRSLRFRVKSSGCPELIKHAELS